MIEEMIRGGNKTKIDRYKWTVKDETGEIRQLNKSVLKVDHEYQRNASERKVLALANSWSWVACGAIVVGQRDSTYWVIDGQHRVLAARRRADIEMLPCLIFQSDGVASEARGLEGDLLGQAIRSHVRRSVDAMFEHSACMRLAVDGGTLRVIGLVYDLASGDLDIQKTVG